MMMMYAIFVVIDFTSMTYQCIGHFVEVIGYTDKYADYEDFKDDIWATPKVKYPTVIGVVALIFPLAVIRDLNCLSFTGYFGVGACAFAVLVVVIECNKYYNHYKDTVYIEEDDSTHLHVSNVGIGFESDCLFFQALANLFFCYTGHTAYFPVIESFEEPTEKRLNLLIILITSLGYYFLATASNLGEATVAINQGADEIDMVINVGMLKNGNDDYVQEEIKLLKEVAGNKVLKVIIETCLLTDDEKVRACIAAKNAGADFVKTSTGFSTGGATAADVALMRKTVGPEMGVKASGGVRTHEDLLAMVEAGATRIGTSNGTKII